jgi:excisionase family DNA binding protein
VSARLLNADEVAERLGMTRGFVYRLAREDRIPHVRLGRTYRFRDEAIARWLEEQERGDGGRPR